VEVASATGDEDATAADESMLEQDPNMSSNGTSAMDVFNTSSSNGDGVNESGDIDYDAVNTSSLVNGDSASGSVNASNVGAIDSNVSKVSKAETMPERKRPIRATCFTVEDPLQGPWGYAPATPGSPCLFGQDPRDEGSHCILDEGRFGSNGWCFTSIDLTSWGSCCAACPLYGPAGELEKKMVGISARVQKLAEVVTDALNSSALAVAAGATVSVDTQDAAAEAIGGADTEDEEMTDRGASGESIVSFDDDEATAEKAVKVDDSDTNVFEDDVAVSDEDKIAEDEGDVVEDGDKAANDKADEDADKMAEALIKEAEDEAVAALATKEADQRRDKDSPWTQRGHKQNGAPLGAFASNGHYLGHAAGGQHHRVAKRAGEDQGTELATA